MGLFLGVVKLLMKIISMEYFTSKVGFQPIRGFQKLRALNAFEINLDSNFFSVPDFWFYYAEKSARLQKESRFCNCIL